MGKSKTGAVEGEAEDKLNFAVGDNAKQALISLVERIERLEEEKSALGDDITEVYAEAKSTGFDTKILRQAIRIRKMDAADREEAQAILDLYLSALGVRS